MSTKTTFKRIALVAVASLGFGMLTTGVSQAANSADVMTLGATASTASSTVAVSTTVSITGISDSSPAAATATAVLISAPVTSTNAGVLPTFSITAAQATANAAANASAATASGVLTITPLAAGRFTGTGTLTVTPDAAGTYVYRITPAGSVFNVTPQTWTVTVAAKPSVSAAGSTVYKGYDYYNDAVNVGIRGPWVATSAETDALSINCFAGPGFSCARIKVTQGNGSTTAPMVAADAVAITATVTGPALVEVNGEGAGYQAGIPRGTYAVETSAQNTAAGLTKYVYVWSTGVPGPVSVEIKAGTVVLGTKTINFYESAKTFSVATGTTYSGSTFAIGANVGAVKVTAKDALGNVVPNTTIYAFSGTTATATVTASAVTNATGVATFDLTGVAVGSSVISFGNASTLAASTITGSMTASVTKSSAATVTMSLDKSEYAPGEKAVLTITAVDSNGAKIADGNRAVLVGLASNLALTGGAALTDTTVFLNGSVTKTVYAPATPGTFIISATEGAATDSTTKATLTATATITNVAAAAAEAATDAAAEAIDAANAATDAANLAAEAADAATVAAEEARDAADAATAAVEELAAQVATLMAALKAQITTLANTVAKIAKKVKA